MGKQNSKQNGPRNVCCIWLEEEQRILSFHEVEGYRKLEFSSKSGMMEYAMKLVAKGFRVW